MGSSTLLDTNAAIYLTKGGLPEHVKQQLAFLTRDGFNLSIVTKIELLGYAFPDFTEKLVTTAFVNASLVYPLDDAIAAKTIEVRTNHKIKLPDAIIAATALTWADTGDPQRGRFCGYRHVAGRQSLPVKVSSDHNLLLFFTHSCAYLLVIFVST